MSQIRASSRVAALFACQALHATFEKIIVVSERNSGSGLYSNHRAANGHLKLGPSTYVLERESQLQHA